MATQYIGLDEFNKEIEELNNESTLSKSVDKYYKVLSQLLTNNPTAQKQYKDLHNI